MKLRTKKKICTAIGERNTWGHLCALQKADYEQVMKATGDGPRASATGQRGGGTEEEEAAGTGTERATFRKQVFN